MIDLRYIHLSQVPPLLILEKALVSAPSDLQEKYASYIREEDKIRFLLGRLLLKESLSLKGYSDSLDELKLDDFGKPFLHNLPSFHFNISHSGSYILCASSLNCSIGVDVEQIKVVELNDFKDFIPDSHWENIVQDESFHEFYRYWTLLESVLKADGRGFSVPFESISFDLSHTFVDQKKYTTQSIKLAEGYECALAYCGEMKEISLHESSLSAISFL